MKSVVTFSTLMRSRKSFVSFAFLNTYRYRYKQFSILAKSIEAPSQRSFSDNNSSFNNPSLARNYNRLCSPSPIRPTRFFPGGAYTRCHYSTDDCYFHDEDLGNREDDSQVDNYIREVCSIPGTGQRVMVIQTEIRQGPRQFIMTTSELKLEETCTLVGSLKNWIVVDKMFMTTSFKDTTRQVFGIRNLEKLRDIIHSKSGITAVVVGIDRLNGEQVNFLQTFWGIPVYDRYTVILQIFREHAKSEEAKLQVALAEIPYVRSRLRMIHEGGFDLGHGRLAMSAVDMRLDDRRYILKRRETSLKKDLSTLSLSREMMRAKRRLNSIPTVAVVGYTNCGKTTLIKALTNDDKIQPKNRLFATLDVTSHLAVLPSNLKVNLVDTVGFISDMPPSLLNAFRTTLEDAMAADIVLHIRDSCHPDRNLQVATVHQTLNRMLTDLQLDNLVEVYNKTDVTPDEELEMLDKDILHISAVTGKGLTNLTSLLEKKLLKVTDQMEKTFRVPNGGDIYNYLVKETAVKSARPDPRDSQFLIMEVIISQATYGKFTSRFARINRNKTSTH